MTQYQQTSEARRLASLLKAPGLKVQLRGVARDTNPRDAAIVRKAVERIEGLEAALKGMLAQFGHYTNNRGSAKEDCAAISAARAAIDRAVGG
jgi:cytochrome c556